jgi:hypothetical protein
VNGRHLFCPAVLKDTRTAVQAGIDQGKSLDQLKQEKVLAKWE